MKDLGKSTDFNFLFLNFYDDVISMGLAEKQQKERGEKSQIFLMWCRLDYGLKFLTLLPQSFWDWDLRYRPLYYVFYSTVFFFFK